MEEEFQGGVCGGNWWMNPSRNLFGSSPCSSAVNDFGWYNHGGATAVKTTSTDSAGSASASDGGGSVVLQGVQNPHQPTLQTTHDWNQDLHNDSGRSQENYSHFLNTLKQVNPSFPLLDQIVHQPNSLPTLPLSSDSYSYTSSLLQTLFDADSSQHHHQSLSTNYSSPPNYQMNSTMLIKPSLPKQQIVNNFQFANNTPFWNASAHVADSRHIRPSFPTSTTHPQLIPSPLTKPKLNPHTKHHYEKVGDTDSMAKKAGSEPAFKRARIETPSPLPTFKVRKEKLGDRVTALQQLVSPFGKTDTASVLHEAIEYIKLLHDQVTVLSTPYLKNGSPTLQPQQGEEATKDLRSRGLCLVPISSTFPVAAETSDFWSPTFGGSFR